MFPSSAFDGSFKAKRSINLGGQSRTASRASRDEMVARAQAERLQRLEERRRLDAVLRLQVRVGALVERLDAWVLGAGREGR